MEVLKKEVKTYLEEKKEKDRLERININSKLNKVTIYTNKQNKNQYDYTKSILDFLDNEGIKYEELDIEENKAKWTTVASTVNLAFFPTVVCNRNYLVNGRDFQNPQQLAHQIQYIADPNLVHPNNEDKLIEHLKTTNYNLHNRMGQLEGKLNSFIDKLSQLLEEESE